MHDLETCRFEGLTFSVRAGRYGVWDRGIIEEVAQQYLWQRINWQEVTTCLDIGAHIGAWTLRAAKMAPWAQIVAVEPHLENYLLLTINTHAKLEQIQSFYGAVHYGSAPIGLEWATDNSGAHTVRDDGVGVPVDSYTVERLMVEVGMDHLDVMKVDCEGSERNIFLHIEDETLRKTHWIVGEFHCTKEDFLMRHHTRIETFFHVELIPHPNRHVKDLGMFFMENRVWPPTVSNS